jgi:sialic acid synthase SpsE
MKIINSGTAKIDSNEQLYFIADIAANHDGDFDRAIKLIELAKESGANAAKFQNFIADKIVSKVGFEMLGGQISHQKAWKKPVYDVYKEASISFEWTALLKEKCDEIGIEYFTSPYDFESVDLVDPYLNVYKIGSGDITWPEILEYIAIKGKPIILSTGASTMEDVMRAMEIIGKHCQDIVLMQCNTNYTSSIENFKYINLNVLKKYRQMYPHIVLGLSDHTLGHSTVLGAIALGATVFEKHFTDNNNREGPDHKFAMNPESWREMVNRSYELFYALGDGNKRIEINEMDSVIVQRRSLRATCDLTQDHVLQRSDLEPLRPMPSDGIPPYELSSLIGKKLQKSLKKGEHITNHHI